MWLYETTPDDTARFILGTKGINPLVCIGVNPSTASPKALDATLRCVQGVSRENPQFDSFIMLNIYPQRATNPNDLHKHFSAELKEENERHISKLIGGKVRTVWAAWGALVEKRLYLAELLYAIAVLPELQHCTWVSRGALTKNGHPHHPLYVKKESILETFDMALYQKRLRKGRPRQG